MRYSDFDKNPLDVKTNTIKDIAKKHNVDEKDIMLQLKIGSNIEMEHTNDVNVAIEIALDHLNEMPDYYTKLVKMEKE